MGRGDPARRNAIVFGGGGGRGPAKRTRSPTARKGPPPRQAGRLPQPSPSLPRTWSWTSTLAKTRKRTSKASRAEPAERQGFRGIPTWEETVGMLSHEEHGSPLEAARGRVVLRPEQPRRTRRPATVLGRADRPVCPTNTQRARTARWSPAKELIDALYRERVERARQMPPEEKVLAGSAAF